MDGNRIKGKYVYTVVAVAAGVGFLIVLILYKKFSANWGGINIFFIAGVLAPIVMIVFSRLPWFNSGRSTPKNIIALVVLGLILNVAVGIHFTEQPFYEVRRNGYVYEYPRVNNIGSIFYLSKILDFDIDLDSDSGIGLVILFLVALIFFLIIGSFTIPHFWVVSGVIMTAVLFLLAMREYMVIEGSEEPLSGWSISQAAKSVLPDKGKNSPYGKETSSDKAKLKREQIYREHLEEQKAAKGKFFKR
jgi:hypothetical protein